MPTDPRDDEYDDRGDERPMSRREEVLAAAGRRLIAPGIGLILTGVLALGWVAVNFVQLPTIDAQLNEAADKIEQDPQIPVDQKKAQKDMLAQIQKVLPTAAPVWYAAWSVAAVLTLAAGVSMLTRYSRGLSVLGAVTAMIPCVTGFCCLTGIPFGIWALIVLGNPDVKAAFAAKNRPAADGFNDER